MSITAYALTIVFLGSTYHAVHDPISLRPDITWDECIRVINNFDPGLSEVDTAIAWCVERDRDDRVIRIERAVRK